MKKNHNNTMNESLNYSNVCKIKRSQAINYIKGFAYLK